MSLFVFNIETIPDVDGGRRLYDLEGLTDKEVANVMFHKRRQETGSELLRLHLHRIVTISVAQRSSDQFSIFSLDDESLSEKEIIEHFFNGADKDELTMVSWNGKNFDLPVLHFRSLIHGVQSTKYWETANSQPHTDLMKVLAGNQADADAPLNEVATLLGFPGNMGVSHNGAWDNFQDRNIKEIRDYCEVNVLNTYLIYLRFELINGNMTHQEYEAECDIVRNTLSAKNKPHLTKFLNAWQR